MGGGGVIKNRKLARPLLWWLESKTVKSSETQDLLPGFLASVMLYFFLNN